MFSSRIDNFIPFKSQITKKNGRNYFFKNTNNYKVLNTDGEVMYVSNEDRNINLAMNQKYWIENTAKVDSEIVSFFSQTTYKEIGQISRKCTTYDFSESQIFGIPFDEANQIIKIDTESFEHNTIFDSIIDFVSASNPKWALGAIDEYVDPNNGHYHRLFTRWATNAPEEAAEAVDLVPDEFRSAALRSIADNWPEVDDAAAERWLLTLNENDRETVLATFTARRKQLEGS